MNNQKKEVDGPTLPCQGCLKKAKNFDDEFYIAYCSHNWAGSIFDTSLESWQTFSPIAPREFEMHVNYWLPLMRQLKEATKKSIAQKSNLPPKRNN